MTSHSDDLAAIVAELRRLHEAATPGEWQYYADVPSVDPNWHIVTNGSRMRVIANMHIEPGNAMDKANADLVPAMRNHIVRLLDAAERAAKMEAALYAIIDLDHHNHGPSSRASTIARRALGGTDD